MTKRSVKALLFSDVKGFSKMTDRECLVFCQNFYSGIQRDVFSKYDSDIALKNTWGDALQVVMDDLVKAGHLALDLRDWVSNFDWIGAGVSSRPQIRIGLHAGVVSHVEDPIISGFNYIGRNTSKAARIEPITFEGQVFVSQAYACLLAVEPGHDLICDYVGIRDLPKQAGDLKVYMLRLISGLSKISQHSAVPGNGK